MTLCAVGIAIKFALVVHCQGIKAAKVLFCVVTIINDFYVVMMARPVKRICINVIMYVSTYILAS